MLPNKINSRVPRYKYVEIAEACGVTPQAVGLWVRTGIVSDKYMEKLAAFFHTTPAWFKYGVECEPQNSNVWMEKFDFLEQRVGYLEKKFIELAGRSH